MAICCNLLAQLSGPHILAIDHYGRRFRLLLAFGQFFVCSVLAALVSGAVLGEGTEQPCKLGPHWFTRVLLPWVSPIPSAIALPRRILPTRGLFSA